MNFLVINIPRSVHNIKEAKMLRAMGHEVEIISFDSNAFSFIFIQSIVALRIIKSFLRKTDYVHIFFADYHAFIPIIMCKIFGKKSILIIGGYDASCFKELKYGVRTNPIRLWISNWCIKNAHYVLPVAEVLGEKISKRVPHIKGKYHIYHCGFDEKEWFNVAPKKKNIIVTVSNFKDRNRMIIKGLDFFINVARNLPEYTFQIIGGSANSSQIIQNPPANLEIIPQVDRVNLRKHLSEAKVYAQFSITEGMPNAVCEAMLCECIPIATNVGNVKLLIGDTGHLLEGQDLAQAEKAIKLAIARDDQDGRAARKRIIQNFSLNHKKAVLTKILEC